MSRIEKILFFLFGLMSIMVMDGHGCAFGAEAQRAAVQQSGAQIKEGEVLTLERCIALALAGHPSILSARGTVEFNRSAIGIARSDYYPQVDLSASIFEISGRSGVGAQGGSGTFAGPIASSDPTTQISANLGFTQNIYDFGRRAGRVKVQKFNAAASDNDLEDIIAQTIFNVKNSYFFVLKARRDKAVAEDVVRQFEKHLEQARALYSAGIRPKFDVTRAEVDASNAKLSLYRADNALQNAKAALNNAMGTQGAPRYGIEDILSYRTYPITLDEALDRASANRPDIKASEARLQAANQNIEVARAGNYPALAGSGQYGWSGNGSFDDFWNIGASVSFPVFNGYLVKHQVDQARANATVSSANGQAVRQAAYLEVEQAYITLKNVEQQIPAAELAVRQAQENFDIVTGMYTAGLATPIEVTDAEVSVSNAMTAYTQALFDYKIAQSSLERAMGLK